MEAPHFFTYLTILLKISNHLALILPCKSIWNILVPNDDKLPIAPDDTEEQVCYNLVSYKGVVKTNMILL